MVILNLAVAPTPAADFVSSSSAPFQGFNLGPGLQGIIQLFSLSSMDASSIFTFYFHGIVLFWVVSLDLSFSFPVGQWIHFWNMEYCAGDKRANF